jgi:SAM-dependent methyltransferase
MSAKKMPKSPKEYDVSINWRARLRREVPVLEKVLGPPGGRPLLDAACGTGRHAVAMAGRGYHVVGIDKSAEMVDFARTITGAASPGIEWRVASFAQLPRRCRGPFAGIYCIGNSLSAAGSEAAVKKALSSFASVLAPNGRLFIQMLNYPPMRQVIPCVKGPVHFHLDGIEHLRFRVFDFARRHARVTNVTATRRGKWTLQAIRGRLFVFNAEQLQQWYRQAGLRIEKLWGSYAGERFKLEESPDLIVVARRGKRGR